MDNVHGSVEVMAEFRRSDYERIVQRLEGLADRMTIRKAINLAAKRAAQTGVTMTKRGIAADYTIKQGDIANRVSVYQIGSALGMMIGMKISDTARPLSAFSFTPKKPNQKPPTVEVKKGEKTTLTKGAFVAPVKAGEKQHVGIFERIGESRLPIRQLPGPSVTGMFKANEEVHNKVWDAMFETFEKRVEHELERLLNG